MGILPYTATMLFCTLAAALAFVPQGALPKLIVPKGKVVKRKLQAERGTRQRLMTAAEVHEVVATERKVKAVLPWATLSARRMHIDGKADIHAYRAVGVSGPKDRFTLAMLGETQTGSLEVYLGPNSAGKTFVVIVYGDSYGAATLDYEAPNGTGELPASDGNFRFPIAVTGAAGEDSSLRLNVKTPSWLVQIYTIQIFRIE